MNKYQHPSDFNVNSAKAAQDFFQHDFEKKTREREVERSAIQASMFLERANSNIQSLNKKQELQIEHLVKLVELQRLDQEAQKQSAKELRFINWTVLAISLVGTVFTVISYFK